MAVRAGNLQALGILYERKKAMVYACAYRCLASAQDAEDVLQDVFVGLSQALRLYTEEGNFDGWLRRVAVRSALMSMRRQNRLREEALDHAELPARPPSAVVDRVTAREAIERLPDPLRVVFMLKEIEGYSHAEIAALLDIRAGTSAVRLSRAWTLLLAATKEHP